MIKLTLHLTQFFAFLAIIVITIGCGEAKPTAGHTHLWIGDKAKNIWSYERVETYTQAGKATEIAGFLEQEIKPGDSVEFVNGSTVQYDGTDFLVNEKPIVAENVHLESDGTVRENALIKVK